MGSVRPWEARRRRLCPGAVVVSPRMSAYVEASKALYRVFEDATPLVEGMSIDEAFLDVRGMRRLAGSPTAIAMRLRRDVRERVGLPVTIGVARTKFLAKVASGVAKPDGLLVVQPDRELAFLHALPSSGSGVSAPSPPTTSGQDHDRRPGGRAHEGTLVSVLGRATGRHIHALASNRDPRPVQARRRRGSIGAQRALGRSRRSADELDAALLGLVDRVTRLRAAGRVGRTVVLRLRFDDFSRNRSGTLQRATAETHGPPTCRGLLATAMPLIERRGITLIGVAVCNLENDLPRQLTLPFACSRGAALDAALDEIRDRYGVAAMSRAVLLGRDTGLVMPMLPD